MTKSRKTKTNGLPILLEYAQSQTWLVHFPTLERMVSIAELHCNNVRIDSDVLMELTDGRDQRAADVAAQTEKLDVQADTAIIQIDGVIAKHSRLVNGSSQPRGTSIESLNRQLDQAMEDARVQSVFLRIESPGGSGAGLADFGDRVFQASAEKPVVAFADDLAASAAYWIGSQASVFYANQSAFLASIGVFSVLTDSSAAAEAEGFDIHIVGSGQHKGLGVPGTAVTPEHLEMIQTLVDQSHEEFVTAVLRGRADAGIIEAVLRPLADGRVLKARDALTAGLIDGIMTMSEAFNAPKPNTRPGPADTVGSTDADEHLAASAAAEISSQAGPQSGPATEEHTEMADKKPADQAAETTAAVNADRKRVTDLNAAFGNNPAMAALLASSIADGSTVEEAKAAAYDIAQASHTEQLAAKDTQIADRDKRLKIVGEAGADDVDAAEAPDAGQSAATGPSDDGEASTYTDAVERMTAGGMRVSKAHIIATKRFPKSKAAMVATDSAAWAQTQDAHAAR